MLTSHALPIPVSNGSDETLPNELYLVAEDLMQRAATARQQGDERSSRRFLRAALDIMTDKPAPRPRGKQTYPETEQAMELLSQDWQEASHLMEATGLSVNRVHSLLARLRKRADFQTQTIKRYRLFPR